MALNYEVLKKELIAEFQLDKLPPERQEEIVSKMGEALFKRIFLSTMDKIGEAGVREYESLLEKEADAEEIEAFFEAKIPGYNGFVQTITDDFKAEMKSSAA